MSKTDEKAKEFFSDQHRQSHLSALINEHDGYIAKAEGCASRGEDAQQRQYLGRAEQVAEELSRIGTAAKVMSELAERRTAAAPSTGEGQ